MQYKFIHSILGGTFDHFHRGHKNFLEAAFKNSQKVTIGITSQNMVKSKQRWASIEELAIRRKCLEEYLRKGGFSTRYEILQLNDIFGNTLNDRSADALFVIPETLANGEKINDQREKNGLKKLEIVVVQTINSRDGKTISSTRIRNGEIDRDGNSYLSLFEDHSKLILPDSLRESLKTPFGEITNNLSKNEFLDDFIIAVGDIAVSGFIKQNITPDLSLFDGKTNRIKIVEKNVLEFLPVDSITLSNNPGEINCKTTLEIYNSIQKSMNTKKKTAIRIEGEEDLLALPAILFSPLDAKVIYGLRDKGAVIVKVTEDLKQIIKDIVLKFEKK